ncbi:PPOX class F420-dependent oxidoreductase [Nocardia sp. NPDC051570]|uniref:PPOX class F420-dependent oxidoreductase n=1 Tax=Nocardia sp. NPDC051570 TaxID=3364324 RepID=UPI0037B89799
MTNARYAAIECVLWPDGCVVAVHAAWRPERCAMVTPAANGCQQVALAAARERYRSVLSPGNSGRPRQVGKGVTVEFSVELKKYVDTGRPFVTVATIGPDGQPHLTVTWLDRDGSDLLYSTTVSRQQYKNMRRDPRVTVMINPPDNPYAYAEIRGTVTLIPDPERAFADRMSIKYTGQRYADFNPESIHDAERVIVRITPTKVLGHL